MGFGGGFFWCLFVLLYLLHMEVRLGIKSKQQLQPTPQLQQQLIVAPQQELPAHIFNEMIKMKRLREGGQEIYVLLE